MRKGKFLKPKATKRKLVILALSLIVLLAAAVGGTAAYLSTASQSVTNTFIPAEVSIEPTETKTETGKSDIQFLNQSNIPVYVRATLVIYWTDMIDGSRQPIAPPADGSINIGKVKEGWFQEGDIYYCCAPVDPGQYTGVMLEPITVTLPDGSSVQCHIDVHAEAIQASPASAVEQAWTDVKVDTDGKLTKAA